MKRYRIVLIVAVAAIVAMVLLVGDINVKKAEKATLAGVPTVTQHEQAKSENWEKYYPRQYDAWKRTKSSHAIDDMLVKNPQMVILWAGYGFAKDYNAPRGHYYALQDNINTLRTGAPENAKTGPMPTACWTCKSPDVPRMIETDGEKAFFTGTWAEYGHEILNSIGCADCHDGETSRLKVRRPHLDRALLSAGLDTFENASFQEKRSLVCAQCHAEYYFKKTPWTDETGREKTAAVVTLPWAEGFAAEDMERYYDAIAFTDWTHGISKAPMLKAQHPGYEIYKTGIHGQKGVSCADCHMPYTQEGAVKFSDHRIQSPLNTLDRSCMTCHREEEKKLLGIVQQKLERKEFLNRIAMDNLGKAHLEAGRAWKAGATEEQMRPVLQDLRHGQWRWDYAVASHGAFFHAPEETLRLLASANEKAQQARLKLVSILAGHGVMNYSAPDFSTKAKAQKLSGVNPEKLIREKKAFKNTLEREWKRQGAEAGKWNPEAWEGADKEASYFKK